MEDSDGEHHGMERFSMDGEYEGGRWMGGEFFYEKRKSGRMQTRDDALYGVFAGDSSGSDDGVDNRRRNKRRRGEGSPDLTKPVNFVSTGTVMPSDELPEDDTTLQGAKPDAGSGVGVGFGLGFRSAPEIDAADQEAEYEESFLPTAFGRKIKEGAEQRKKEREREKSSSAAVATVRRTHISGSGADIGKFESHTKGIGLKLMKMMGYKEGTGLGKNEQGIVTPVEGKLRPKNMGMGYNDYKEPALPSLGDVSQKETLSEKKKSAVPVRKEKLWTKSMRGRGKSRVLTKDELLSRKDEGTVEVVQKVIDMRGPQVKVLASLENLNMEQEMEEADIPMPELQYNMRLIVETTEVDLQKMDRDLKRVQEKVAVLAKEKDKMERDESRQRLQLAALETIYGVLQRVKEGNVSGSLTLPSLLSMFADLKVRFAEEYKLCNLACIAGASAFHLLIKVFQGWEPLMNPMHGIELMVSVKDLLQGNDPYDYSEGSFQIPPYVQLVSEVILPAVRISGTNSWQARDPEPMLQFLEAWKDLLPPVIVHSILDNVVMPKLSAAVDLWDPRRERVPIHIWVHPWLLHLKERLETLYHTIRYKLSSVLHAWLPSDKSAYAILSPWKGVFDAASWEDLMVRFILPKLKLALQEFQINPADQKYDQFNWVVDWVHAIPINHMVHLFEVDFFPKWHQVLYHWLHSNPDYAQVMNWYALWRDLLPAEIVANERIRVLLTAGLDMMRQAADGTEVSQPGAREHIDYLRATEHRQFAAQQQSATPQHSYPHSSAATSSADLSFKESIQAFAMEQGILFMPRVGRFYNGLPVYEFGAVSICIDSVKRLLYAPKYEGSDGWTAVTLTELMEMNRAGRSR